MPDGQLCRECDRIRPASNRSVIGFHNLITRLESGTEAWATLKDVQNFYALTRPTVVRHQP